MTWSLQSLEDSQLSCTAKFEAVVCGDVGQLSFNAGLKVGGGGGQRAFRSKNQTTMSLYYMFREHLLERPLACVVTMQEGSDIAPKRRQLTLRRTFGCTGVSRKYRPRFVSIPRRIPGT